MSDFDDDLPPLDDMSEQIAQFQEHKDLILQERDARQQRELQEAQRKELEDTIAQAKKVNPNVNASLKTPQSNQSSKSGAPSKETKPPVADDDFLPGFKKGFLFKKRAAPTTAAKPQSSTSTEKSAKTKAEEPIVVQPIKGSKEAAQKSLEFPEVAAAMNASASPNWVTNTLLETVAKDDILSKGMQNPRILQALGELQQNPTAAFSKYSKDVEVTEFLQTWITTMAGHAQQMQEQQKPAAKKPETSAPSKTQTKETKTLPQSSISSSSSSTSSSSTSSSSTTRSARLLDSDIGEGVASLLLSDNKSTKDAEEKSGNGKKVNQVRKPGLLIEEIEDDDGIVSIGFGKSQDSGKKSGISLIEEVDDDSLTTTKTNTAPSSNSNSSTRKSILIEEVDDTPATTSTSKPTVVTGTAPSTTAKASAPTVKAAVPAASTNSTKTATASASASASKSTTAASTRGPTTSPVGNTGAAANANVEMVDFNGRKVPKRQLEMWMAHPLIRSVLADPVTNSMLAALRNDVNMFPKIVSDQRIQVLIRAGILEVPPQFQAMFRK